MKRFLKDFFYSICVIFTIISVGGCSGFSFLHSNSEQSSISVTVCHSPKGGKGVQSLGVVYFDFVSDFCYENVCRPLQDAGARVVFYCNLSQLESFVCRKDSATQQKLQRYSDAGHIIGIFISKEDLVNCAPKQLLDRCNDVKNGVLEATGICINTLRLQTRIGSHPFEQDLLLSQEFILDDSSDYCHIFYGDYLDYRDVADEALQGEKWAKFFITSSVDGRILTEMIQYLKEHKIDVVPYPEMELYRKQLYTSSYAVRKEERAGSVVLKVQGICKEYPHIPMCYSVRQYENDLVKNERVFLLKHDESVRLPLKNFQNSEAITAVPTIQLTMLPRNGQASLVFTIDDTNLAQVKEWYPVIKKYGLVSTHFLSMGSPLIAEMLPKLKEMEQNGFEIGCHSYSRTVKGEAAEKMIGSKFVGNLPENLFVEDLNKALEIIHKDGLHCEAFSFPGNFARYSVRQCVKKHFPYVVRNNRYDFNPEVMKFKQAQYLSFLQKEHYEHIHMFHTPIYGGQKILESFEPLFALLAEQPLVINWTYSQMQAYLKGRTESEIVIYQSDNSGIRFGIKGPRGSDKIPCLLPMTCRFRIDPKSVKSICMDGEEIQWKSDSDYVYFDSK